MVSAAEVVLVVVLEGKGVVVVVGSNSSRKRSSKRSSRSTGSDMSSVAGSRIRLNLQTDIYKSKRN